VAQQVETNDSCNNTPYVDADREKHLAESQARDRAALAARRKLEDWFEPISQLSRYRFISLLDRPNDGDDGLFDDDEIHLLTEMNLEWLSEICGRAREMVDHMENQLQTGLKNLYGEDD
jgi:hypothetical protein